MKNGDKNTGLDSLLNGISIFNAKASFIEEQ